MCVPLLCELRLMNPMRSKAIKMLNAFFLLISRTVLFS
jgi:hypothetical protein